MGKPDLKFFGGWGKMFSSVGWQTENQRIILKGDVCKMSTQKTGYEVDGQVVTTLKELSSLLGQKVTQKDLEEGKYDQVNLVDLASGEGSDEPKDTKPADKSDNGGEFFTALSDEDIANLQDVDPKEIKESMPEFESIDELKEFIKDMDTPTLEYLATGLGLEWNPTYHANIHRMRVAMAMHRHFFPELFQPKESKKKKAKYGDFDTETLFDLAKEHDLDVKKSGNDPIDRMRVIMALKKEGHLPEEE